MALKKANKTVSDGELKKQLEEELVTIREEISERQEKVRQLKIQLLELEIKPFKIGDYALVEVPCGKSKKWQKCLLECESGMLYVRPVKDDGELSGRHFSIYPLFDKKYSDYLKEVK